MRAIAPDKAPPHLVAMTDDAKPEPAPEPVPLPPALSKEIGGPPGPEPTRYGDWQFKGRVTDF